MMQSTNGKKVVMPSCAFCKGAGESKEVYTAHWQFSKPVDGKLICPLLLAYKCKKCNCAGHVEKRCPVKTSDLTRAPSKNSAIESKPTTALEPKSKKSAQSKNPFALLEVNEEEYDARMLPVAIQKKPESEPQPPVVYLSQPNSWAARVRQTKQVSTVISVKVTVPEPASLEPASLEPASLEPASLEPASLEPASLEPASLEPASLEPAENDKPYVPKPFSTSWADYDD
jgi:hypothetical protein